MAKPSSGDAIRIHPKPQLYPEAYTRNDIALYRAGLVSVLIGDQTTSDRLGTAVRTIEGAYLTGLEDDIEHYQKKGYVGNRPRPKNMPRRRRRETTLVAKSNIVDHERRVTEDLLELNVLQDAFPDLLYAVCKKSGDAVLVPGTDEKVVGFSQAFPYDSLLSYPEAVYHDGHPHFLNPKIAMCDISQFDAEQRQSLQSFLVE